ncbi:MAG: DASS family sodium-coupled anion symporter [Candidatus Marinimicrobia bacterium]|nr:DASS family sodium-coupled anion symporter [Candidatus Neomarinimicrobiota bacterium]
MSNNDQQNSGGFAKTTDFKWLSVSIVIFVLLGFATPPLQSMVQKAAELFPNLSPELIALKAKHIQITIALLATCVIFFATEAIPMPAVALLIGLVQLLFGITEPSRIVSTYAHDAVWFIAGSLAIGATLVKYKLDKRIGIIVINLAGTNTRKIVFAILLGTAIPTAFVGEHAIASMFVPIAVALYTITNRTTSAPNLGRLLLMTIAVGCMVGGPMSPTGGARNAIMIGFLSNIGVEVSFGQWLSMGVFYTVIMSGIMALILPMVFKPEVSDLGEAVTVLKQDLEKHGSMTKKQWLVTAIMTMVIFLWITDKSITKQVMGFSLGLGGVAMLGAVTYMILGLTSWKDYESNVSWGVIVLYAGAISLGAVFKSTGAASWLAGTIMSVTAPLGMDSGLPLIILVIIIGATLTNLMSAGATVAVIGPVILDMASKSGTNPLIVGIILAISTSMAFWLVIGTPASSIVYSSGKLEPGDFIRNAVIAWPIAIIVAIVMVAFYWINILNIPLQP